MAREGKYVVGARLSEPHTSELNGGFFRIYILVVIRILYVCLVNAMARRMWTISNIFVTFSVDETVRRDTCMHLAGVAAA